MLITLPPQSLGGSQGGTQSNVHGVRQEDEGCQSPTPPRDPLGEGRPCVAEGIYSTENESIAHWLNATSSQ